MCNILNGLLVFIKDLGPTLVGLTALGLGYCYNKKLLKSKNTDERRKEIHKQLNEFYGPLQQMRNKSKHLYDIMVQGKPEGFRTLIALLKKNYEFSDNDKKLIAEIISIGKDTEDLILKQSGLVDNDDFRKLLGKATAHFVVLRNAFDNTINGDVERFENYVFPRDLDPQIEENIKKLKIELNRLNEV